MKKVILLVAALFILLTSVCSAFEQPDPSRWLWVSKSENADYWIDFQTTKFEKETNKYDKCYGHRFVDAWIKSHNIKSDEAELCKWHCDLDCEKFKVLSLVIYDKQGNVKTSINQSDVHFQDYIQIVPGSVSEGVLFGLNYLWNVNENMKELKEN